MHIYNWSFVLLQSISRYELWTRSTVKFAVAKTFQTNSNDKSFKSNKCRCRLRVRHLASSSHNRVESVSACSSGVKVEAFSSIIDDSKALLDRLLGRWVWAVWGSIGDGAFVRSYGQNMLCIRSHPHTSTGVSNTTLLLCCIVFDFFFFRKKLGKLKVSQYIFSWQNSSIMWLLCNILNSSTVLNR